MGSQNLAPDYHNTVLFMLLIFTTRFSFKVSLAAVTMVASTPSNMRGNETDKLTLLAIKAQITDDPLQTTSSWNESLHFCQWKGVSCGPRHHQRVTWLELASLKLKGRISPSIGNLSFVRVINLSNNSLKGEIPHEMSRLSRLQRLLLGNNSLVGQIPSNLSLCSDLRVIFLKKNGLTGQIPTELSFLSRLEFISVAQNSLTGKIPPYLGNLSSLQVLDLGENSLVGHMPASLGRLKFLYALATSNNFLSGRIVPEDSAKISNNQSSTSGLKGTIGYAAPEYGMGSKVSKEGDVYSFGILLLELFTGKRPTDSDLGEEMNLNQFVKSALPESVMEIIDQGIIPREGDEATTKDADWQRRKTNICECCVSVLKIGVICSDEFPRERMKIDEALKQLQAAKKMFL